MKRGLQISTLLFGACLSLPAFAQDNAEEEEGAGAQDISLGMAPGTPQVAALPGGVTPSYGQSSADERDWRFDFHGFFTMPLRAGLNKRSGEIGADQKETVLHAPPMAPDGLRESFSFTGVIPQPYVQLNFSYGNSVVSGNVIVLSRTATGATAFFDPPSQAGINDAFLRFNLPNIGKDMHFEVNVGAFTNRYGTMGEYDEGKYGTPIIGRTNGAGENIVAKFAFGKFLLAIEQGIQAQTDKPPNGLTPDGWSGFADPNVGSSFVNHAHLGLGYAGIATLGLHYMNAWSQDDRASQGFTPDGSIRQLGADLRLSMGRFGHLYLGAASTKAQDARSVGRIIEIMNSPGGPGLIRNYLGGNGSGSLLTFGGQYDLSLARLLRPEPFEGDGPDIVLSLFGIQTKVSSDADLEGDRENATKRKIGAEGAYSILPWLAAGVRYDRVEPNADASDETFAIISPRIIFRSGFQAHDQVVLQYSRFMYGSNVGIRDTYRPTTDPSVDPNSALDFNPDEDVISLSASMWW
jgi:hypothetical protein